MRAGRGGDAPAAGTLGSARGGPVAARGLLLLMAIASGVGIANLYLSQPLLGLLTVDLGISDRAAGLVVTATQLGYAAGIVLLTPLAAVLDCRRLTLGLGGGAVLAFAAAALAPSLPWLVASLAAAGLLTVTPQILIVVVAGLGGSAGRGRALATLAGGAMVGNSLAYLFSGTLGDTAGWRAVYGTAAVINLVLLVALRVRLPRLPPPAAQPYRRVMASLPALVREQPAVRQAILFQMCAFGSYTAFWATLPFHVREAHGWGAAAVGLLGVLVVGPALALPYAGRIIDRRGPLFVTRLCLLSVGAGFALVAAPGAGVPALVAGTVLLAAGMQASQVANQTRIFAADPEASARLNTIYMTGTFVGGSSGSAAGAAAWSLAGWNGVCALGGALALIGLMRYALLVRGARGRAR